MKYIIFVLLISFTILGDINSQDCCIPEILLNEYDRDVKHLALLRMELLNVPEQDFIDIDQLYQDTIWERLAAIFHSESVGRDAVFDQFCIHHNIWTTFDYLRISSEMYVQLDSSAPWYQNWVDGNITTDNSIIDSLTQKYGFEEVIFTFPTLEIFKLTTNQYINLSAFADSIEMNNHVIFAERGTFAGGSTRIAYQKINGYSYFNFVIGWGDCPSGCIYWHTWSFAVDDNCNVDYLGTSGSGTSMLEPLNCNSSDNIPIAEINLPRDTFCVQETEIELIGGLPSGGEYSGQGITNSILNPSETGIGTHIVTYTFEGLGGCSYTASQEIIINQESCLTDIDKVEDVKSIQIYPNPTNGELSIQLENIDTKLKLELINTQGKIIYTELINSRQFQLSGIPKGIFFLKLSNHTINDIRKVIVY